MRSSTAPTVRKASQPKFKAACDQCHANKVKCPGGGTPCQRCADSSQLCNYSLARRNGKPPGTRNRKTLERLAQAKEANLEQIHVKTRSNSLGILQDHSIRDSGSVEAPNFDSEGAAPRSEPRTGLPLGSMPSRSRHANSAFQLSSMHNFWPLSSSLNSHSIGDSLNKIQPSGQELLGSNHDDYLDEIGQSMLYSADLELPDFEDPERAGTMEQNVEATDGCDNVSNILSLASA